MFRVISNPTRRAKAKLFLEHTWMKYSKTQDSVYCALCRFFGPYMLIVFDSKSSLIHYTFDKIKFLSQLHICIILLYLIIFYFPQTPCRKATSARWGRVSWPSTRLLNRFEYTSFWGSYAPEHVFFCPGQVVVVYLFICYEEIAYIT